MKKIVFILLLFQISFSLIAQDRELRKLKNDVFKRGEKFVFHAYYHSLLTGNVSAGKATLEIKNENIQIAGRNTLHVVGTGTSVRAFNWFFKVNDRYETYIDEDAIVPWLFVRRVNEGGFIINQDIIFNQYKNYAKSRENGTEKTKKIPLYTQDIISIFYNSRLTDASKLKVNDSIPLQFFLDDSVFTIKIIYEGKENIKTKAGEFRCLRFKPMVLTGNVFKEPYPMTLWISDDNNHIPVLVSSAVIVGSVKLELVEFEGLANYPAARIK